MKTILKSCSHPAFVLCVVTLALAAGSRSGHPMVR